MPSRNRIKYYTEDAYYHVYNRGVEKRQIFMEDADYAVYLNLLKRYLGKQIVKDPYGRSYKNLYGQLELLAYCLMPNHFHLLFYQSTDCAIFELMQRVNTAYTLYFNKKYNRVGHLFQDCYKASNIFNESYLQHISRYIHLNPEAWQEWQFSSLAYYLGQKHADWVRPHRIRALFEGDEYFAFVKDYENAKLMLTEIKHVLASCSL